MKSPRCGSNSARSIAPTVRTCRDGCRGLLLTNHPLNFLQNRHDTDLEAGGFKLYQCRSLGNRECMRADTSKHMRPAVDGCATVINCGRVLVYGASSHAYGPKMEMPQTPGVCDFSKNGGLALRAGQDSI